MPVSSGDSTTPIQIAQFVYQSLVTKCCITAISGLVVYEYIITLGREVELFWKGRWTGAAVLFYFNRYLNLLVNVYGLTVTDDAHISAQSCAVKVPVYKIIDVLQYLPWAAFSTLRALALSRSYLLATIVFCLSILPIPMNLSEFRKGITGVIIPFVGCTEEDDVPANLLIILTIICRTCLIAVDLLLVYISWAKLYRRDTLRHALERNGFIAVLLRDGTIYFIVLLLPNVLHLIEPMVKDIVAADDITYAVGFWEPITAILTSRFLLHLQAAERRARNLQSITTTTPYDQDGGAGTLIFERVMGSIAASIDIGTGCTGSFDEDEDRDEEEDVDNLPTRVTELEDQLTAACGKDGPDSGVDLEGGGTLAGMGDMGMTPPSQSP